MVRPVTASIRFREAAVDFAVRHSTVIAWAVFLVVGVVVLDDYGMWVDEVPRRGDAIRTVAYVLGDDDALPKNHNRFYGVAFELPLLAVERILGLEDSRHIYLSRHLLTHLFFLVGGLFCALLVYRLFGSRVLALRALLLFLLHPRLYAHSFFNTKDVPFLSMFMIALFFIHRAFGKDTTGAFLICGVGVGLLTNIRILGVMLFAAVLGLRALDLCSGGWAKRTHVLLTSGVFALTSMVTLYATWPFLWSNPFRFVEGFPVLAWHPHASFELFQGEFYHGTALPAHYIPTWIAITTPPVTLLLGIVGVASVLYQGMVGPRDVPRNTDLRFGFLLLACLVLPIVAVIVLDANIYSAWRHLYFLSAPVCLLGMYGLHGLVSPGKRTGLRAGAYALVGIGLAVTVVEVVLIHPHSHLYFNALVDRRTPEHLRGQHRMDDAGPTHRAALEYLLERYPGMPLYINMNNNTARNVAILPAGDRQLIHIGTYPLHRSTAIKASQTLPPGSWNRSFTGDEYADFHVVVHRNGPPPPFPPIIYALDIYNNTVLSVTTANLSLVDSASRIPIERSTGPRCRRSRSSAPPSISISTAAQTMASMI